METSATSIMRRQKVSPQSGYTNKVPVLAPSRFAGIMPVEYRSRPTRIIGERSGQRDDAE